MISDAVPPSAMPQRGPACSASRPTSGAPIGVEPRKTTEYSAITRPRIGPAASCSEELTPAANVTLAAPVSASTTICTAWVGAIAASS